MIASLLSSDSAPPDSRPPDVVHDVTPAAAAPLRRCGESMPIGPFGSQKEAVAAVKHYAVRQGYNRIGIKRAYLRRTQGKHYKKSHGRPMALIDHGTKKVAYTSFVAGSNTLDNQCGANITDSSASGASLPLANVQRKVNN